MRLLRSAVLFLVIVAAASLVGCGGGSSAAPPPPAPVFTSTPGTVATQDVAYAYQLAATDPSGGAVSFALTTSPTGATLTGNTLSWTPSVSQSRISDAFTVTALTPSGGRATQSWTVAPSGTVTLSAFTTFWSESGPEQIADSLLTEAAIVPNTDGSVTVLPGSMTSPGMFSIANVPAGYFWITEVILPNGIPINAFWTSSSNVDLGRDVPGPQRVSTTLQNTTFNFDISGLDTTAANSLVAVATDDAPFYPNFFFSPASGANAISATTTTNGSEDWSKLQNMYLMQYEPISLGSLNSLVLGPALTVSNPGFTPGATNTLNATLTSSPQSSLSLTVPGSQWATSFNSVGPSPATPSGSWLSISTEPFITGRNQSPNFFAPNLPLLNPAFLNGAGQESLLPDFCLNGTGGIGLIPDAEPSVVTDTNFGTLQYGDPFPASWTRAVAFCQVVFVPVPVVGTGNSLPFLLSSGVAVPPSGSLSLAPLAGPVANPTINGASLFTEATINTTVASLSWSQPAGTGNFSYRISSLVQTPQGNGVSYATAGTFTTAKTSAMLPPLTPGNTYVFEIATMIDGSANVETSPFRSSLPTGFATIVSAPITVSAGANTPLVRGDAKVFKELFTAQRK